MLSVTQCWIDLMNLDNGTKKNILEEPMTNQPEQTIIIAFRPSVKLKMGVEWTNLTLNKSTE